MAALGVGPAAVAAQELPPPGGWPLRPVPELTVVPEPPGGLVPYRKGQFWGYADTTGRVWIQPQFEQEPPLFGQGLLLRTGEGKQPWWHARYGIVWWDVRSGPNGIQLTLDGNNQLLRTARSFLLNVRGEQLVAGPDQALVADSTGHYWAVKREEHLGQPELLVVQPRTVIGATNQGHLFTRLISAQSLLVPERLSKRRRFHIKQVFTAQEPFRYSARKVNWLRPRRQYWGRGRCGERRRELVWRYRHRSQEALFDERGHRLTAYCYAAIRALQPGLLLYMTGGIGGGQADADACRNAGLPNPEDLHSGSNSLRYGLLTTEGQELTPANFLSVRPLGRGLLWVVAPRQQTLHYGILDSLGRYVVPLAPEPLSCTDAAGLLRRRSAVPWPRKYHASRNASAEYPDTATVSYLRPDGQQAFPGRFQQAGAFWQGRALVRQHGRYGIIDTLGQWVLPPQEDELSYYNRSTPQVESSQAADPLRLFDAFYRGSRHVTASVDSVLLLVNRRGAFGLIGGRSGRTVIAPCFDEEPEQWRGAAYGLNRGDPLVVTVAGYRLRPSLLWHGLPAGVGPYEREQPGRVRAVLERTPQGYRTRGGRPLWED